MRHISSMLHTLPIYRGPLFAALRGESPEWHLGMVADELEYRGNSADWEFAERIRKYSNERQNVALRKQIKGGWFEKPLGPFYTELSISAYDLAQNMELLYEEPIEGFTLFVMKHTIEDARLIVRNQRMMGIKTLTIVGPAHEVVGEIVAPQLQLFRANLPNWQTTMTVAKFRTFAKVPDDCRYHVGTLTGAKRVRPDESAH